MRGGAEAADGIWSGVSHLFVLIFMVTVVGAAIHAGGHVAATTACGATVSRINILGLQILPQVGWQPQEASYGGVHAVGSIDLRQSSMIQAAGSGATLAVAFLAALSYLVRRRLKAPLARSARLGLSLLWVDAVVHTLPRVGVPVWKLFGLSSRSHPMDELYDGITGLGVPNIAALVLILASPLVVMALQSWARRSRR